jgi:hypothetical protein
VTRCSVAGKPSRIALITSSLLAPAARAAVHVKVHRFPIQISEPELLGPLEQILRAH